MKAISQISSRTALLVLGMHRSGTSSVAGAFSLLGGTPPRTLMPAADDNPRGFWESAVLMEFHDRILEAGGSSWRDWRPFPISSVLDARPDFLGEGRRLLESEFGDSQFIVLKDPRVCRFSSFWNSLLTESGYRTVVVSPLRPPLEVAASLTSRNDMEKAEALRLWLRHVLDAERDSRSFNRIFVEWAQFLTDWRTTVCRANDALKLAIEVDDPARSATVDDFISSDLRRQVAYSSEDIAWVSDVYSVLHRFATNGEDDVGRNQLDEIRTMFDASCEMFSDAAP